MNDATLQSFRDIAEAMGCGQDKTWAICRRYLDTSGHEVFGIVQFGCTKEQAEKYATYYKGGLVMPEKEAMTAYENRKRKVVTPQV